MTADQQSILISDAGQVRTITLNRPDVLNGFNMEMLIATSKAIRQAARDNAVRCLVIAASGRGFCSGQDLAEVAHQYQSDEPLELGAHLRKHYNPMITKIRTMEKPVIAAVNGVAAGAGFSLALACDMRIAGESASFIDAFVHVGLVPDCGGTFTLPRLVGAARAFEIAATGRKVKSAEAVAIGLVTRVVPDDELADAVKEYAAKLASLPPLAIGLTKRAMNKAWNSDLEAQLDYEAMLQTTAGRTHDHREGVAAFLEKRPPKFTGE